MFRETNQGTKHSEVGHPEVGPLHFYTLVSLVTLEIFLNGDLY